MYAKAYEPGDGTPMVLGGNVELIEEAPSLIDLLM
jgi:hypothetical protein